MYFNPRVIVCKRSGLDTTNIYARASLETKRKALEKVNPSSRPAKPP